MAIELIQFAKLVATTFLVCAASNVHAAKPVQKVLPSAVANAGAFSQEFLLSTSSDYSNQIGAVYAWGLSATFSSLSIEILPMNGQSLTGTIGGVMMPSNSWKASFADKSSTADLFGQTQYKLRVWGSSKVAGAEYLINGTGVQSISAVPEPANATMFLAGLGLFGVISIKRAKRR